VSAPLAFVGRDGGRDFYVLGIDRVADWPRSLVLLSNKFIVLLVIDDPDGRASFDRLLETALDQGAVAFCVWGRGCERVELAADEAIIARTDAIGAPETDDTLIVTTSHPTEPVEDAVFYFSMCAWPSSAYEADCTSWLAVTVGMDASLSELTRMLRALFKPPTG
jgi:hypothetical protein